MIFAQTSPPDNLRFMAMGSYSPDGMEPLGLLWADCYGKRGKGYNTLESLNQKFGLLG